MLLGIRQFNNAEWFECHETLEELWAPAAGEVRDLYQGIIQLAIALHHWRNDNFPGAVSLLESGANYLSRVTQPCLWVDVRGLIQQATTMREGLLVLGPQEMARFDQRCLPRIATVSQEG